MKEKGWEMARSLGQYQSERERERERDGERWRERGERERERELFRFLALCRSVIKCHLLLSI